MKIFLKNQPDRLKKILAQATRPLKDAAAVNATRWALVNALKTTGLLVETSSGSQTKFNRSQFGIPKTHALDAACVGAITGITDWQRPTLCIKATGRGSYQRTLLDKYGCVRGHSTRKKRIENFQTGDRVKAVVTKGTKIGTYVGRVAVRETGSFNIQTKDGLIQGISHRYCTIVQRGDGYGYQLVAKTDVTGTPPKQGMLRIPHCPAGLPETAPAGATRESATESACTLASRPTREGAGWPCWAGVGRGFTRKLMKESLSEFKELKAEAAVEKIFKQALKISAAKKEDKNIDCVSPSEDCDNPGTERNSLPSPQNR